MIFKYEWVAYIYIPSYCQVDWSNKQQQALRNRTRSGPATCRFSLAGPGKIWTKPFVWGTLDRLNDSISRCIPEIWVCSVTRSTSLGKWESVLTSAVCKRHLAYLRIGCPKITSSVVQWDDRPLIDHRGFLGHTVRRNETVEMLRFIYPICITCRAHSKNVSPCKPLFMRTQFAGMLSCLDLAANLFILWSFGWFWILWDGVYPKSTDSKCHFPRTNRHLMCTSQFQTHSNIILFVTRM